MFTYFTTNIYDYGFYNLINALLQGNIKASLKDRENTQTPQIGMKYMQQFTFEYVTCWHKCIGSWFVTAPSTYIYY